MFSAWFSISFHLYDLGQFQWQTDIASLLWLCLACGQPGLWSSCFNMHLSPQTHYITWATFLSECSPLWNELLIEWWTYHATKRTRASFMMWSWKNLHPTIKVLHKLINRKLKLCTGILLKGCDGGEGEKAVLKKFIFCSTDMSVCLYVKVDDLPNLKLSGVFPWVFLPFDCDSQTFHGKFRSFFH